MECVIWDLPAVEKLGCEFQVGAKIMMRGSISKFREEIQLNVDEVGIGIHHIRRIHYVQ